MKRAIHGVRSLFLELRRRKVFRVAAVYVATAFVIAQAADIFLPGLGLPEWSLRLVLALLILGFPLAIVLSWIFDLTPDGIRRTSVPYARSGSGSEGTGWPGAGSEPSDEPSQARAHPARGTTVGGRYELLERIGAGAMGVVHRARDIRLGRDVALKFLPDSMGSNSEATVRFLQEARAAAALNHPNITTLHAIEDHRARPFLVMELVEGETLETRLARSGPLEVREATGIAAQIASGLHAAHAKGIVHRDIKPANVMVTADGLVKIMDFGIAKVPGGPAMTRAGSTMGSAAYMSPEQVRGEEVDGRSDLWGLGVVLYEMLSGRLPFPGDNEHTVLHRVLHEDPEPLDRVRGNLPAALTGGVMRALSKDRAGRPASAGALLSLLGAGTGEPPVPAVASTTPHRSRARAWRLALLAPVVLAAAIPAAWLHRRSAAVSWAHEVEIPQLLSLVEAQDCLEAMIRADALERVLPGDRQLAQARTHCSVPTNVVSEPPGAEVYLRAYGDPDANWFHLGTTPMVNLAVPEGLFHWRIEAPGYEPMEKGMHAWEAETLSFELIPTGEGPEGMVRVPGGPSRVGEAVVELGPFWIDEHEVTNAEYQTFVAAGAYRDPELWTEPFVLDGRTLPWSEAMALLRDATGQPGPATWELGGPPDAEPRHPVAGVSWYEAVAYCHWAGKELPTIFHWKLVAGSNEMFSDILWASNLDGTGASAVGAHPGISRYGAYDMAGNVKEWTWNRAGERRYILGGAWDEPMYRFMDLDAHPPLDRRRTYGFRCAGYDQPPEGAARAPLDRPESLNVRPDPVPDEIYRILLRSYAYDDTPLNARVDAVDDGAPHWRRETVSLDAAYGGERFTVHLFFPRDVSPPYQAVVYSPSAASLRLRTSGSTDVTYAAFIPRGGRVLVHPVLKGTYERRIDASGPQAVRDMLIQRAKDVRRTVDYLATRNDIDPDRIAFYGLSMGAHAGPVATAVEPRFAASILVGGGLRDFPDMPEVSASTFAPRVSVPTLMINGRHDFMIPYETSQRPLYDLLGTSEPHKELKVFEVGHVPDNRDVIRESSAWLDRYLGPVRR